MKEDYKILIDSAELQQKVLDYIGSDEFDRMIDNTVFKDESYAKMAVSHGMAIASMLTCRCEPFCIHVEEKLKEQKYRDIEMLFDECEFDVSRENFWKEIDNYLRSGEWRLIEHSVEDKNGKLLYKARLKKVKI